MDVGGGHAGAVGASQRCVPLLVRSAVPKVVTRKLVSGRKGGGYLDKPESEWGWGPLAQAREERGETVRARSGAAGGRAVCTHKRMYSGDGRGEVSGSREEETDHRGFWGPLWRRSDFEVMGCNGCVLSKA